MIDVKIKETGKDYYSLTINGSLLGVFERSDFRYMIEQVDGAINVGLGGEEKIEMSKEGFARMIAEAKLAAEAEGDDCTVCGS
tara:strand:+ start:148 stop:396 length:249 start_codon:yes stop_codon:yes gene_type:complete